ncbi:unnamed protein product [Moneuplotes crassus]|uniref:Uncharacterized protein n=1 Tax=Euplotes crassus TaxID=5936 RepID=A0AAD1U3U9_EUPCR|nr:unnamed protein product [Moneuplotes crassus]
MQKFFPEISLDGAKRNGIGQEFYVKLMSKLLGVLAKINAELMEYGKGMKECSEEVNIKIFCEDFSRGLRSQFESYEEFRKRYDSPRYLATMEEIVKMFNYLKESPIYTKFLHERYFWSVLGGTDNLYPQNIKEIQQKALEVIKRVCKENCKLKRKLKKSQSILDVLRKRSYKLVNKFKKCKNLLNSYSYCETQLQVPQKASSDIYRESDVNLSKICINIDKIHKEAFDGEGNTSNSLDNSAQESIMIPEETHIRSIEKSLLKNDAIEMVSDNILSLRESENTDEFLRCIYWKTLNLESKATQLLQRIADSCDIKSCTKDAFCLDSFPEPQIAQNHPLCLYKVQNFKSQITEKLLKGRHSRVLTVEKCDGILNLYAKFKPEPLFNLTYLFGEDKCEEYQWEMINTGIAGVYQDFVERFRCTFPHHLLVLMDIATPECLGYSRSSQTPVVEKELLKEYKCLASENIRLDFSKEDHKEVFDIISSMRLPDLKKISIVSSRIPVNFFNFNFPMRVDQLTMNLHKEGYEPFKERMNDLLQISSCVKEELQLWNYDISVFQIGQIVRAFKHLKAIKIQKCLIRIHRNSITPSTIKANVQIKAHKYPESLLELGSSLIEGSTISFERLNAQLSRIKLHPTTLKTSKSDPVNYSDLFLTLSEFQNDLSNVQFKTCKIIASDTIES